MSKPMKLAPPTTLRYGWYFTELIYCVGAVSGCQLNVRSGEVAQLVEHRTGTSPTQVRFPGAARDFSPRVNFQCRLSHGVRTPQSAIACIYICAHVKVPVIHVRVRWIMETLKHSACTLLWVARHCRSWLSPGKATRISHGRNPIGTIQLLKKKRERERERETDGPICDLRRMHSVNVVNQAWSQRKGLYSCPAHALWNIPI